MLQTKKLFHRLLQNLTMLERNYYEITLSEPNKLQKIISALKSTDIVVHTPEDTPPQNTDTITITAEDSPSTRERFDKEKDPLKYITPKEIKTALQPYTNSIQTLTHKHFDTKNPGITTITKYNATNSSFSKINQTKQDLY